MKTFNLSANVTVSIFTSVEAETLEEAIEIAKERHIEHLQNYNTAEQAENCWVNEEYDGEPMEIKEDQP